MAAMTSLVTALTPALIEVRQVIEARRAARLRAQMQARDRDLTHYGQAVEMGQLRRRQDQEEAALKGNLDTRLAQMSQTADADEKRRRAGLRRVMARTRSRLAAQGIDAAGGSGEALLLGLVSETDEERRQAASLDRLRAAALERDFDDARRRNLLELNELAERQRLELLSKGY